MRLWSGNSAVKIRAELTLTSLLPEVEVGKCDLSALYDAHRVGSGIRWIIVMLFIHGVWSASRAAVTHQRTSWNSILWLFVCVHMLVCVLSYLCTGHFQMTLQGRRESDWSPPVTVSSKLKHLLIFVKFYHLIIEIKSYLGVKWFEI